MTATPTTQLPVLITEDPLKPRVAPLWTDQKPSCPLRRCQTVASLLSGCSIWSEEKKEGGMIQQTGRPKNVLSDRRCVSSSLSSKELQASSVPDLRLDFAVVYTLHSWIFTRVRPAHGMNLSRKLVSSAVKQIFLAAAEPGCRIPKIIPQPRTAILIH